MTLPTALHRALVALPLLLLGSACVDEEFEPIEPLQLELIAEHSLHVEILEDTVVLTESTSGERFHTWTPEEPIFLRGSIQIFQQQRRIAGGNESDPWMFGFHPEGGHPVIHDPVSGLVVDLMSMGPRTVDEFRGLFAAMTEEGAQP